MSEDAIAALVADQGAAQKAVKGPKKYTKEEWKRYAPGHGRRERIERARALAIKRHNEEVAKAKEEEREKQWSSLKSAAGQGLRAGGDFAKQVMSATDDLTR